MDRNIHFSHAYAESRGEFSDYELPVPKAPRTPEQKFKSSQDRHKALEPMKATLRENGLSWPAVAKYVKNNLEMLGGTRHAAHATLAKLHAEQPAQFEKIMAEMKGEA